MIILVLVLHVYIYGVLGLVDSALTRRIDYISPTTSVLDYASAFQMDRDATHKWQVAPQDSPEHMCEISALEKWKSYGYNEQSQELVANPRLNR